MTPEIFAQAQLINADQNTLQGISALLPSLPEGSSVTFADIQDRVTHILPLLNFNSADVVTALQSANLTYYNALRDAITTQQTNLSNQFAVLK